MTARLTDADAIAGPTVVTAIRIGLVGDDHASTDDGADLPEEVLTAFEGVDLIVHLGHMGTREILGRGALERLEKVAPVLGVRDYSTTVDGALFVTPAAGDRIAGLTRVIDTGRLRIGVVHNLGRPPGPAIETPPGGIPDFAGVDVPVVLAEKFGAPVDVVAFAGSHRAVAIGAAGVLFVNPGSPTYPKGPGRDPGSGELGTVAVLDLSGDAVVFELIELSALRRRGRES